MLAARTSRETRTDGPPRRALDKDNCGVASRQLPILQLLVDFTGTRCFDYAKREFFLTGQLRKSSDRRDAESVRLFRCGKLGGK
ncbi:unnamed protein product [Acanthoscelides obtectus]|uniref:Uncharacterized protein n=1 Tax=Acanthoscelides obtectus TaxID=200917 RepID=A0A9P0K6P8_ACAOB|nr:unnamed protein product [Acanthoscelides obtectus]CAK1676765.1 hypothetical protein AOBTE_LOCUS30928 [Acanthoscelides obtectus]